MDTLKANKAAQRTNSSSRWPFDILVALIIATIIVVVAVYAIDSADRAVYVGPEYMLAAVLCTAGSLAILCFGNMSRAGGRYTGSAQVGKNTSAKCGVITIEDAHAAEFPYRCLFTPREQLQDAFLRIKGLTMADLAGIQLQGPVCCGASDSKTGDRLSYRGKKIILKARPTDKRAIGWVSDWFGEPERVMFPEYLDLDSKLSARVNPDTLTKSSVGYPVRVISPIEYWDFHREAIIKRALAHDEITYSSLSDEVYKYCPGKVFPRAYMLRAVMDWLGTRAVLDLIPNWGDGLIAALASGARYSSISANLHINTVLLRISDALAPIVGLSRADLRVNTFYLNIKPIAEIIVPGIKPDLIIASAEPIRYVDMTEGCDPAANQMRTDATDIIQKCWSELGIGGYLLLIGPPDDCPGYIPAASGDTSRGDTSRGDTSRGDKPGLGVRLSGVATAAIQSADRLLGASFVGMLAFIEDDPIREASRLMWFWRKNEADAMHADAVPAVDALPVGHGDNPCEILCQEGNSCEDNSCDDQDDGDEFEAMSIKRNDNPGYNVISPIKKDFSRDFINMQVP